MSLIHLVVGARLFPKDACKKGAESGNSHFRALLVRTFAGAGIVPAGRYVEEMLRRNTAMRLYSARMPSA